MTDRRDAKILHELYAPLDAINADFTRIIKILWDKDINYENFDSYHQLNNQINSCYLEDRKPLYFLGKLLIAWRNRYTELTQSSLNNQQFFDDNKRHAIVSYCFIYDLILYMKEIPYGYRNGSRLYTKICQAIYPIIEGSQYDSRAYIFQPCTPSDKVLNNYFAWFKGLGQDVFNTIQQAVLTARQNSSYQSDLGIKQQ